MISLVHGTGTARCTLVVEKKLSQGIDNFSGGRGAMAGGLRGRLERTKVGSL